MLHLAWIATALLLVGLAVLFWPWIPYLVVGAISIGFFGWILVSTLSPAVPDRTCPECREAGLVKIRRGEPGVRCERCGFRDEDLHVAYLDEW